MVGICMFAVVPTNELDYLAILLSNKKYLFRFSVALGILSLLTGLYSLVIFVIPLAAQAKSLYALQLIIMITIAVLPTWALGAWHLLSMGEGLKYCQLQKKCKYTILLVPYILIFGVLSNIWVYFSSGNMTVSIDVNMMLATCSILVPFGLVILYEVVIGNATLINGMIGRDLISPVDVSEINGKGALALYMLLYISYMRWSNFMLLDQYFK